MTIKEYIKKRLSVFIVSSISIIAILGISFYNVLNNKSGDIVIKDNISYKIETTKKEKNNYPMSKEECIQKSKLICRRFCELDEYKSADNICIYISKGNEVNTKIIVDQAWKDGKKVYVTEVIAEEAYFADTRREAEANPFGDNNASGATFNANAAPNDFSQVTDDDLPF